MSCCIVGLRTRFIALVFEEIDSIMKTCLFQPFRMKKSFSAMRDAYL